MSPYSLYLIICGLGSFAARTASTLNLIYQATVVGLSPLQLVLVGTLMETVCFLAQVPTGVLADLVSRRLSVIVGYALMAAGLLLWGLIPDYGALLAATVVWSIGAVCVDGAEEAWAADEIEPERVAAAFVRGGQVAQAGSLLGILAATGLATAGLAVPVLAGGVLTLALAALLAVVMREERWAPAAGGSWRSMGRQVRAGAGAVRHSALLACVVAGTVFAGMSSEGFDRLGQPFLLPFIGDLPVEIAFGGLAVLAALGSIAVTGVLGRRLDTLEPGRSGRLVAVVTAVTAAGMIGFGLAGTWWLAVPLYLLVSLLRGATDPVMNVWLVAATTPGSRATVFSIQAQADALGQIAGGPPAGLVAQHRSLGAGISAAGLFLLPAVALFALASRRLPRVPEPGATWEALPEASTRH